MYKKGRFKRIKDRNFDMMIDSHTASLIENGEYSITTSPWLKDYEFNGNSNGVFIIEVGTNRLHNANSCEEI